MAQIEKRAKDYYWGREFYMKTPFNLGSTVQVLGDAIVRYRDNEKSGNRLLLFSFTHLNTHT